MEIYSKIYDQNKNMQFNPLEIENNKKIINPYMNNYSNYMIESTQESNPFNTGRLSYNIILKSSLDKAKRNSKKDNYLYNTSNINDITNTSTNNMKSKNDISFNIQMDKDDIDEKNNKDYNIVNQNFFGNNNLNDIERIKVEEKQINANEIVMDEYYENNFDNVIVDMFPNIKKNLIIDLSEFPFCSYENEKINHDIKPEIKKKTECKMNEYILCI
jgi:hypothetical protein